MQPDGVPWPAANCFALPSTTVVLMDLDTASSWVKSLEVHDSSSSSGSSSRGTACVAWAGLCLSQVDHRHAARVEDLDTQPRVHMLWAGSWGAVGVFLPVPTATTCVQHTGAIPNCIWRRGHTHRRGEVGDGVGLHKAGAQERGPYIW